jgi:hypothetical protein
MRPIHFQEANTEFVKPNGMTDEECGPLSAYVGENHISTVWQPNKEDIEAINAGRPIIVQVCGLSLPPISLFTTDENGNSND